MSPRKIILKLHLYLGLTVGLLFALIGVTGSLLVFSEEFDRALNPSILSVPVGQSKADYGAVESAVIASFPDEKIYRIRLPRDSEDVYEFWMNGSEGLRVYVDPYTGRVLGSRDYSETFRGRLFLLHTTILGGEWGKSIIGIGAFVFLAIGISGLVLWWRGLRNVKRGLSINVRSGWKRANFDVHNAVGYFAFFLLSINIVSGIYLIFNATFEKTVNRLTVTEDRPPAPLSTDVAGRAPLPAAEIVERVGRVFPDAEATWFYIPASPQAAYMVRKKFPAEHHPNGKSFVYLDQYTGEVLRTENATEVGIATKFVNDLYPMHIGRVGGLPHRLLQVAVGITPTLLLTTGFLIWRNRSRRSQKNRT